MTRQPTRRSPTRRPTPSTGAKKAKPAAPRKRTSAGRRPAARKKPDFAWAQPLRRGSFWGAALILLGVFTLLALIGPSGVLTAWWLQRLTILFGIGMYLFPVMTIFAGLFLFLHSRASTAIPPRRLLGALLLWMVFQAGVHLAADASAPLNVGRAQPGDYGGWVGWVISQGLMVVAGVIGAVAILLLLALLGLFLILNRSLDQVLAGAGELASAVVNGALELPDRLSQLRQGQPRQGPPRPSWAARLRQWWQKRRAAAGPGHDDPYAGPITTLPPDPALIAPPEKQAPPPPPTIRIIGSDQVIWRLPQIDHILEEMGEAELEEEDLRERANTIEETLRSFGVPVTVVEVNRGPAVTQFGLRPEYVTRKVRGEEKRMKVRVSKIQALSNDLSLALAAAPIRIEAPVPGRNIVGLEVPNQNIALVSLRSVLESEEFERLRGPLRIALGQDVSGRAVAASLARMPHLLVAGATGSGKSVCINAVICSLLFQYTPDQLRFVMVDPKRVELTGYNGIPHLIDSVVTDIDKVIGVLHWATTEMDRRYKDLERARARNIEVYNANRQAEGKPLMPYIIIVIDELADIMMMSPEEVERSLVRLAQMARATGIHLVIATQRPSVNVVTGLIKANFPSRVSFAVTSQIDSRVILDTPGAERLLGRGDMLFMRPDSAKLARLQGAFVSDGEVLRLVRYWRGQGVLPTHSLRPHEEPLFDDDGDDLDAATLPSLPPVQRPLWEDMAAQVEQEAGRDELFDAAVAVVRETGRASTSLLQRRLRIGYTRAARLVDLLEAEGIVGPDQGGSRGRDVIPPGTMEDPPFDL